MLLGTGCPLPDPVRAGPATLVRAGGATLLVDCGRAVVMRLAGAGASLAAIDAVLLTHLHSDHVQDLSDVITMRWAMSPVDAPLRIAGPVGTRDFVARLLRAMSDDIGFRMAHHRDLRWKPSVDVTEVGDDLAFEDDRVKVTSAVVDHGVVKPALGFRFDAAGSSIAVSGDTLPCAGLDRLATGANVLVQAVVRRQLVDRAQMQRFRDVLDYHSSTEDAGRTASRAGVGTLVLTHFVPGPSPGTETDWSDDAATEFAGEIVLGHDLLRVHS